MPTIEDKSELVQIREKLTVLHEYLSTKRVYSELWRNHIKALPKAIEDINKLIKK